MTVPSIGHFILNNGLPIPKIGFGTYKTTSMADESIISAAIEQGYRLFDTASFYDNEPFIANAIRHSGLNREDFFLTSKVWKTQMGYENTLAALNESLEKLQTDYLDLYLIHWPRANLTDPWQTLMKETWQALELLYAENKVRAIGVSNFLQSHLEVLLTDARVRPAVNQIEFHPGYTQSETVAFCQKEGIQVEAWSPLGRASLLGNPILIEIAANYGKSVSQLCIRFALQQDVLPLPKSSHPDRMRQNLDGFDFSISEADMDRLLSMPRTGWSGEHPDAERVVF